MKRFFSRLSLQTKIILVLIGVIVPTFLLVMLAAFQITRPLLLEEMRQLGITSANTLAAQLPPSSRMLSDPSRATEIGRSIQDLLYAQPSLLRVDIMAAEGTGLKLVASNIVEEDLADASLPTQLTDVIQSRYAVDQDGGPYWDITVPIRPGKKLAPGATPTKPTGLIHVVVSLNIIESIVVAFWKVTAAAALASVVLLILALSYFLRKTIANDRRLKAAETQNLELSEKLHDVHRELMNKEKLAVMGELTGSFAHEIGTPLNSIGGHLQLLREELRAGAPNGERIEVISGQLQKIEQIVKQFLQSTAKPTTQRQLIDIHYVVEKTLSIVSPQAESAGIVIERDFQRKLGPIRMVPLDLEQILLNLLNNSLDSLRSKRGRNKNGPLTLRVSTSSRRNDGEWAEVEIFDTGLGIPKDDLQNVMKPFFTTKAPGEGTGLGLAICKSLAAKYGGSVSIQSRVSAWTRARFRLPYRSVSP